MCSNSIQIFNQACHSISINYIIIDITLSIQYVISIQANNNNFQYSPTRSIELCPISWGIPQGPCSIYSLTANHCQ